MVKSLAEQPITFEYPDPSLEFIQWIKRGVDPALLQESPGFLIENSYFKMGLAGTHPKVFARAAVLHQLQKALEMIQPEYGFVIFDAYRSIETQKAMFQLFYRQIKAEHADWSEESLLEETRKFAADPYGNGRYPILPHNSGGAVDLALTQDGKRVDFGTEFDDLTAQASTNFFESEFDPSLGISPDRWQVIRKNRRILFQAMIQAGFTNFRNEWWHYDLGNCGWANKFGISWIFDSLEPSILSLA